MQKKRQTFYILILIFFSVNLSCNANGYTIDITINGLSDTTVILGHYVNQSMYPDDTVVVNKNGRGVFSGKNHLDEGMYIVYMPGPKYFDILIGEDQDFSIVTDTSDFLKNTEFKGSKDNEVFFDFKKFMDTANEKVEVAKEKYDADYEKEKLKEALDKIDSERKEKINELHEKYPDLWASTFLLATLDIEVPDPPTDESGNETNSNWAYFYYRHHYFDHFDLSDARLLRTPLYESKLMRYMNKVIPQIPDTIIKEVDAVVEKVEHDSNLFRYTLMTLFNYYGKSKMMGMEAVQVHIAEKYYIDRAWWSSEKYINDLKERVEAMKPTLIGQIAPNIQLRYLPAEHFKQAATDDSLRSYPHAGAFFNVHDIQSEYTVLLFWEPTCGHCKKAVPKFHKLYADSLNKDEIKVIAINTLSGVEGKEKWVDFVNKNNMYDWINAWNPYDYQYKLTYDIRSTPQIFILDDKKEIIAKRIGEEQVKEIIEVHKKIRKKENEK